MEGDLIDKYFSKNIIDPITDDMIIPSNEKFYTIHNPSGTIIYPETKKTTDNIKSIGIGIGLILCFMLLFSFQFTIYVEDFVLSTSVLNSLSFPFLYIGGIFYGLWLGKAVKTSRQCTKYF